MADSGPKGAQAISVSGKTLSPSSPLCLWGWIFYRQGQPRLLSGEVHTIISPLKKNAVSRSYGN